MIHKYTCQLCQEEHTSDWSDHQAIEEKEKNFPGMPMSQMSVTCDTCFNQIMEWAKKNGLWKQPS